MQSQNMLDATAGHSTTLGATEAEGEAFDEGDLLPPWPTPECTSAPSSSSSPVLTTQPIAAEGVALEAEGCDSEASPFAVDFAFELPPHPPKVVVSPASPSPCLGSSPPPYRPTPSLSSSSAGAPPPLGASSHGAPFKCESAAAPTGEELSPSSNALAAAARAARRGADASASASGPRSAR